jgi:hypothetical protein
VKFQKARDAQKKLRDPIAALTEFAQRILPTSGFSVPRDASLLVVGARLDHRVMECDSHVSYRDPRLFLLRLLLI